jgi:ATP-dependent Clp protease ATP-binding subunit ClpC
MMFEASFSNEAVNIFQYIKNELIKKYPTNKITIEYFFLSVLENEDSVAYRILSKTTLASTLSTMHYWFIQTISKSVQIVENSRFEYDCLYDRCVENAKNKFNLNSITSGHLLLSILKLNDIIGKQFKQIGITYEQLLANLNSILPLDEKTTDKTIKHGTEQPITLKGAVEELLIDMNSLAANGKIDEVIGNDEIINNIFKVLSKRDRNNVVVVGDSGIGKTATVSHIANLLINGKVPDSFKNKKLMKMDFMSLVSGAALRGNFEAKFNAIISDAIKKNGYIFFVDDIQSILSDKSKFGEINTENMLDMILMERNIKFICTMDNKSYISYIQNNPSLKRRFQKVDMLEKNEEEIINILKLCKTKYEKFHNVAYTDSAIETCVKLSKKYAGEAKLPDYAIDIIDEIGAKKSLNIKEDERIIKCKNRLSLIREKIKFINNSSERRNYDEYDNLKSEEIRIKSELQLIEKDVLLNAKPIEITEDDIRETISLKTNIPVTKITCNERDKLKSLNSSLKSVVIGQDEAIDEVCRVVKRQRIGISNNNRPAVLFFSGMTGTGKTYLAKKLAQEVFGNEKPLIRLDMSEYSDKMSVNKLYGSAAGYVGYDKGGILTEAIKKNNHCVLLLDEMEKASEDVHNVFLQLFDDGRLTDNMGITVDFSNVIVIMTSNVGAKEISNKGGGIGFVRDENSINRETITKSMKNKFNPEFINRIDSIIYFNKLSENNIKDIIRLELNNLNQKLKCLHYELGTTFKDDKCIEYLYNKIKSKSEYGARPVIYTIQHEIEDKITDYIIDNNPNDNFIFETDTIGFNNF